MDSSEIERHILYVFAGLWTITSVMAIINITLTWKMKNKIDELKSSEAQKEDGTIEVQSTENMDTSHISQILRHDVKSRPRTNLMREQSAHLTYLSNVNSLNLSDSSYVQPDQGHKAVIIMNVDDDESSSTERGTLTDIVTNSNTPLPRPHPCSGTIKPPYVNLISEDGSRSRIIETDTVKNDPDVCGQETDVKTIANGVSDGGENGQSTTSDEKMNEKLKEIAMTSPATILQRKLRRDQGYAIVKKFMKRLEDDDVEMLSCISNTSHQHSQHRLKPSTEMSKSQQSIATQEQSKERSSCIIVFKDKCDFCQTDSDADLDENKASDDSNNKSSMQTPDLSKGRQVDSSDGEFSSELVNGEASPGVCIRPHVARPPDYVRMTGRQSPQVSRHVVPCKPPIGQQCTSDDKPPSKHGASDDQSSAHMTPVLQRKEMFESMFNKT